MCLSVTVVAPVLAVGQSMVTNAQAESGLVASTNSKAAMAPLPLSLPLPFPEPIANCGLGSARQEHPVWFSSQADRPVAQKKTPKKSHPFFWTRQTRVVQNSSLTPI